MALFNKNPADAMMDVIRCDESDYLIWKWSPHGQPNSTQRENAIRWGSSLRVKDGEVAVFVYQQQDGTIQDFIEGPFDESIKTANFPVLASLLGTLFGGGSPFQAEVYFINLAGNIKQEFGVPYFDVADADPRLESFPVPVGVGGSLIFSIKDYRSFIKLHRLVHFELSQFQQLVRDVVIRLVKGIVVNAPLDHGLRVVQIERKLLELNDIIQPRIVQAFARDFGVHVIRLDLSRIEVDKSSDGYKQLRAVTAGLQEDMLKAQNQISVKNLSDIQDYNRGSLEVQRRRAELQAETQYIGAHQIDKQAEVLKKAAGSLGQMGAMGAGGIAGQGGGLNPVAMMTGLAVGGAMGGQMANMVNMAGQGIAQAQATPPPLSVQFHVAVNGQAQGPFAMAQLQAMVQARQLLPASLVWRPGIDWTPAGYIAELAPLFAATPPPPPPPPL